MVIVGNVCLSATQGNISSWCFFTESSFFFFRRSLVHVKKKSDTIIYIADVFFPPLYLYLFSFQCFLYCAVFFSPNFLWMISWISSYNPVYTLKLLSFSLDGLFDFPRILNVNFRALWQTTSIKCHHSILDFYEKFYGWKISCWIVIW